MTNRNMNAPGYCDRPESNRIDRARDRDSDSDSDRLERFARHIILPELGGAGQARLGQSRIVVIGAGGIGSPALQYLAGAGIGHIVIVDSDSVDAANLHRQTIFAPADLGKSKARLAASWIGRFDPCITVRAVEERLTRDNAEAILSGADVVLDGCDNFATRLAVSDSCVALGVPLASAAIGRFQGQVANFAGHLPDQPCYRCYVGDAFDNDDCDTCAEQGVLGAFAGMIGCFGAMQAMRILLDGVAALGDPQWGRLHLMDGLAPSLRTIRIAPDPACTACATVSAASG
ncbi:HesA/MoeB/ThiF family protein [Croceicoccus sp. F390]|uniref:HesA/MoeB/ThiF family protein n=1 Tax=Croceicoccus esteveae TaxID=3075597 RepID=A0ABU2ZGQ4_9SPHN|nr:HesA/MoeB/ThiF family protein [Croceicoccus sp. F390]MDT0575767.1 HesA/MoeB/ThiF family protein [Croceicoccus sp. F390]